MSNFHVKYLLVGGGLAGSEAAQAIRKLDPNGDLLLVGQEINRPYHRPPLSKEFLRGTYAAQRGFHAASRMVCGESRAICARVGGRHMWM